MSDEEERTVYLLDLDVNAWPMLVQMEFRKKVGVTPQYAVMKIDEAAQEARADLVARYGEDAETPEDATMPVALFNIPPEFVIGLAWISTRNDSNGLTFEQVRDSVSYDDLIAAVLATGAALEAEAEASPLPNRAQRRAKPSAKSTRTRKTSSAPAKSSAGRSPRSEP